MTHQNFNCPLRDLGLDGESLKEGRLLWTEGCALGWHSDINSRNGSSFGRCSNLGQQTITDACEVVQLTAMVKYAFTDNIQHDGGII